MRRVVLDLGFGFSFGLGGWRLSLRARPQGTGSLGPRTTSHEARCSVALDKPLNALLVLAPMWRVAVAGGKEGVEE